MSEFNNCHLYQTTQLRVFKQFFYCVNWPFKHSLDRLIKSRKWFFCDVKHKKVYNLNFQKTPHIEIFSSTFCLDVHKSKMRDEDEHSLLEPRLIRVAHTEWHFIESLATKKKALLFEHYWCKLRFFMIESELQRFEFLTRASRWSIL